MGTTWTKTEVINESAVHMSAKVSGAYKYETRGCVLC